MNRWYLAAFLASAAATAEAHHIWIIPDQAGGAKVNVVFSDYLKPDSPETLAKISHATFLMRDAAGKESWLASTKGTWVKGEDTLLLNVAGEGTRTVAGQCVYGIVTHDHRLDKEVEPYLLAYYPKAIVGPVSATQPWDKLPLEIVPTMTGNKVHLRVLFRSKPAAQAEMRVNTASGDREEFKTDERGEVTISLKAGESYGFQTRQIEPKGGEHEGKKYVEVRHYASLVLAGDRK